MAVWLGARVVRAHSVLATRRVIDTVRSIQGTRDLAVGRRASGLSGFTFPERESHEFRRIAADA